MKRVDILTVGVISEDGKEAVRPRRGEATSYSVEFSLRFILWLTEMVFKMRR